MVDGSDFASNKVQGFWSTKQTAFRGRVSWCSPWTGLTVRIQVNAQITEAALGDPREHQSTPRIPPPRIFTTIPPQGIVSFLVGISSSLHNRTTNLKTLCCVPAVYTYVRNHARQREGKERGRGRWSSQVRKGRQGNTQVLPKQQHVL